MSLDRTFEAIWRIESPTLIAALTRMVRDVGQAEELAQDAFVSALTQWPDRRACVRAWAPRANRFCCSIKIAADGINC